MFTGIKRGTLAGLFCLSIFLTFPSFGQQSDPNGLARDTLLIRAMGLRNKGQGKQAVQELLAYVQNNPADTAMAVQLVRTSEDYTDDHEYTIRLCDALLPGVQAANTADAARMYNIRGLARLYGTYKQSHKIADLNKAQDDFLQAVQILPGIMEAHTNLVFIYAAKNQMDQAVAELRTAIAQATADKQKNDLQGFLKIATEQPQQFVISANNVIGRPIDSPSVAPTRDPERQRLMTRVAGLRQSKQTPQAISDLTAYLQRNPADLDAGVLLLEMTYEDLGDYANTIRVSQALLATDRSINPQNAARIRLYRGMATFGTYRTTHRLSSLLSAEEDLQSTLEIIPGNVNGQLNLMFVYAILGRVDRCVYHLKMAAANSTSAEQLPVIKTNLQRALSDPTGFVEFYRNSFGRPIDDRPR